MASAEGSERRGGRWKRLLSKLKGALRRSAVNSIAPSKATSQEPMAEAQPPIAPSAAVDKLDAEPPTSVERVADLQSSRTSTTIVNTPLVADDSIETDDIAVPPLQMPSSRTALSIERAQSLFEEYGIKYEPRIDSKEPELVHDVRRVEKQIRIRIHYSCEECGTSFGPNRTCVQCGHRRCRDCHRNPPKRVREVLHEARQQQERARERAHERAQQAASEQQQATDLPVATMTVGVNESATDSNLIPTEEGALVSDETAGSAQYQYVVQHRPRSAVQLLFRPESQPVRRKCHVCETHFDSANRTECQTCSHTRCNLCPRETMKQESPADEQTAPATITVSTVQRVYKKPRQRVRWNCDQCQALFLDRDICQGCGHVKCGECIRTPPRRIYRPPDPETIEAVEDKLSILDGPSSSSHPTAGGST